MNINAIHNQSFKARINERDYHYDEIKNVLWEEHGYGAQDFQNFEKNLQKLPIGDVYFDNFVQHGGATYVFGTLHKPCDKTVPFEAHTYDSSTLLSKVEDAVADAFKLNCNHSKCTRTDCINYIG